MQGNRIITIGRQYGSGGREIGRRVAKHLGIGFYDKELLNMAAEKAGLHPDMVRQAEEQRTNSLLYSVVMGTATPKGSLQGPLHIPITDQVFLVQADIIRDIAAKESAVIIGRCADYVLREHPGMMSVFVHADMETRLARCKKYYEINEQEARDRIRKIDKKRSAYHNFFSDKPWGTTDGYHLSLDTGLFGVDGCVNIILNAFAAAGRENKEDA